VLSIKRFQKKPTLQPSSAPLNLFCVVSNKDAEAQSCAIRLSNTSLIAVLPKSGIRLGACQIITTPRKISTVSPRTCTEVSYAERARFQYKKIRLFQGVPKFQQPVLRNECLKRTQLTESPRSVRFKYNNFGYVHTKSHPARTINVISLFINVLSHQAGDLLVFCNEDRFQGPGGNLTITRGRHNLRENVAGASKFSAHKIKCPSLRMNLGS
jgi:hypothetical protein